MKEIPVLLYHSVGDDPPGMMEAGISVRAFAQQMQFLSSHGYRIATVDEAVDCVSGIKQAPERCLAISIDGGYRDSILNIAPLLRQHSFPAAFFISPEFIGGDRMIKGQPIRCLTWQEVRELIQCDFTIGLLANGGQGIKAPYDEDAVKERIAVALERLRANINSDIRYCAFKVGVPGPKLWAFLQSRGIRAVFTQCPTNQTAALSGIGRIQIDEEDPNIFLAKISTVYLFFKDRRVWKYIRRYKLNRLFHRLSEWTIRIGRRGRGSAT